MDFTPQNDAPVSSSGQRGSLARLGKRVLAVGAGACVFALVASMVEPRLSPAGDRGGRGGAGFAAGGGAEVQSAAMRERVQRSLLAIRHPQRWPSLGLIEGVEHYVLIHGSPAGPRYTVCSLGGQILQADLPGDEVYRAFPSVDVEGMRLEPAPMPDGPMLMHADPSPAD